MTKDLATVKQAYFISLSDWTKETVLLEKAPDWTDIIDKKRVVCIDWITINGSFIISVKAVDLNDDLPDSAYTYAKSLKWAYKVIACERVRSYEATNGKMPIQKLQNRLEAFRNKAKEDPFFMKWYILFKQNGWNDDDLW